MTARPARPRRVRVVGLSGSGKTTLGATLAERLGVPMLEVDAVVWRPGWQVASQAEIDAALEDFVRSPAAADGWVVDGSYWSRLSALTDTADTVVWLDYSRPRVMARLGRRTAVRLLTGTRLWHGEREQWRRVLSRDPLRSILVWSWTQHAPQRDRFAALAAGDRARTWVRLRTPRAARRWLATL